MKARQQPTQRKMGVNISLDLQTLEILDKQAETAGMTRSAILRRIVAEWAADAAFDQALMAEAEAVRHDPNAVWIPWEEAKAQLHQ
jgi:hypothetical protein